MAGFDCFAFLAVGEDELAFGDFAGDALRFWAVFFGEEGDFLELGDFDDAAFSAACFFVWGFSVDFLKDLE